MTDVNLDSDRLAARLVRQMVQVASDDDLSAYDQIFADPFSFNGNPFTPQQMKEISWDLSRAFPDRVVRVEDVGGDDEVAWLRWSMTGIHTGSYRTPDLGDIAATGRSIDVWGIETFRIRNQKIVEFWSTQDRFSLYSQLGLALPGRP